MAKFCTQCGKRLEPGEVCSCGSGQRGDAVPGEQNVRIQADNGQAGNVSAGQQPEHVYNREANTADNNVAQTGNAQYGGQPAGTAQYDHSAAGTQQAYNAQGFNNQGGPAYQQYNGQQGGADNRWQAEMSRQTVAGAKNMFAQFTGIITRPVSGAADLTRTNAPVPGLAFMIIKALIILLAILFGAKKLEEMSYGYVEMPYIKLFILIALITLGADLLEGVLIKALSGAFGVRTDSKAAFACVAARTVYEIVLMVIFGVVFKLSVGLAIGAYTLCSLILPYIEFAGYYGMSDGDGNKKVFAFFIVKVCIFIIVYLLVKNVGLDILMQIAGSAYSDIVSEFSDALDWLNML